MTRAELVAGARTELAEREAQYPRQVAAGRKSEEQARRGLAAWRAIVALLERGEAEVDPCFSGDVAAAWAEILAAVQAALDHRARRDQPAAAALLRIRSLLLRSAIRRCDGLSAAAEPLQAAA